MTAPAVPRARVLCVDDEPNVLAGLARTLRPYYEVETAGSAPEALARLGRGGAFEVVVSDLRMPEMDGVAFLGRVRQHAPDAIRVLLTGDADLTGAIAAVNEGQVFRFLVKPCATDALIKSVAAAVAQHRLVTAERVLLEQTVRGSIQALTDLLAIAQPAAFGRATRLKRLCERLAAALDVPDRWQVEVAALLSQVGYVVVPAETAARLQCGQRLTQADHDLLGRLPQLAERLIASIPRLDGVRAILLHQNTPYVRRSADAGRVLDAPPVGSRLLRVVHDYDVLEARGMPPAIALDTLETRAGEYDPSALAALRRLVAGEDVRVPARVEELRLTDVRIGMIFATDVTAANGLLLVARGQTVTPSLLDRIQNSWYDFASGLKVSMIVEAADREAVTSELRRPA